jgi:hypothetical protein
VAAASVIDALPHDLRGLAPIPERGLAETCSMWTGQGQLWRALAAAQDTVAEREWTARDLEHRALRVLHGLLEPQLATWPTTTRAWLDALPASTEHRRSRRSQPSAGTLWSRSRVHGWPPRSFETSDRHRTSTTVLTGTVRWCLEQLAEVAAHAARPEDDTQRQARERTQIALGLLDRTPLRGVQARMPDRADLHAVRAEGRPWRSIVPVCEQLLWRHTSRLEELALRLVAPDPHTGGRLFHLAVLGEVLHALRTNGADVTSRVALGAGNPGPHFVLADHGGRKWQLWFEAAGSWTKDFPDPYLEAARALFDKPQPLGADLMLCGPNEQALLIECKYSLDRSVVAAGYHQAVCYATEMLDLFSHVTSVVVGPSGVVREPGWTTVGTTPVGFVAPEDLAPVIQSAVGEDWEAG